jgi:UDP-glucose 4-epimerase
VGRYLVTGGCGFIGSHLVDALCGRGHTVRILDDLSTENFAYKPPNVEFVRGDVAEPRIVLQAMRGVEGCFHLAAVASVERGNSDWLGTHRTNLTGTVAVFDAARRGNPKERIPVVFASSAAVYGGNPDIPLSEDATPRPLSAYGADKLGCELHGSVASHVHRVPTCGLRFFNVYGPRQDPTSPYSGVISIFCNRLKARRGITVYGDGHQTRDFIYVGGFTGHCPYSLGDARGAERPQCPPALRRS